jgi:hypothetical protein
MLTLLLTGPGRRKLVLTAQARTNREVSGCA